MNFFFFFFAHSPLPLLPLLQQYLNVSTCIDYAYEWNQQQGFEMCPRLEPQVSCLFFFSFSLNFYLQTLRATSYHLGTFAKVPHLLPRHRHQLERPRGVKDWAWEEDGQGRAQDATRLEPLGMFSYFLTFFLY